MGMGPKGPWRHTELEVLQAVKTLGTADSRQIGAAIGRSHKWVEDKLRLLKAAERIYISDWKRHSVKGPPRECYSIKLCKEDVNVPRPPPMTASEKTRNYQARLKQRKVDQSWKPL